VNKPHQSESDKLDLVVCTLGQCGKKIDFEIAQKRLRTQKENIQQQVRQVQQVRKSKTKTKEKI